ncbi:MAG: hypothetical protein US57_C0010G0029 [Candidatus Moranbacteria bacterium GW2011_GWC2_37_73]|nr:MAG: hypothetical protein UR95_C0008G0041 [Parcubacteria group bacterium GW2011_GWC1_36_108]KKQ00784.1 MAG: hypothetical protein US09_C0006G0029 [Candidatus Moranbacteria bacterium GW2011_GWD1_36_198]KKQ02245.1 MAG: hypothetical protein US10_C0005G0025 [Candidatus Moranbacteria bacterium GW2011_GWD2_36_198]KKQ39710.1 MAG: hypothetical protein US57_C0010G0029 [Candidatus Moranbacteria bacterium GW2011_GWC2_37_73]HAR99660.1 hypothetical protein [Candidatus Moranbacteria bacterium]
MNGSSFENPFLKKEEDQKTQLEKSEIVYNKFHNRLVEHREGEDDWMMETVEKNDPAAEMKKARLEKSGWQLSSEGERFWVYEKEVIGEKKEIDSDDKEKLFG